MTPQSQIGRSATHRHPNWLAGVRGPSRVSCSPSLTSADSSNPDIDHRYIMYSKPFGDRNPLMASATASQRLTTYRTPHVFDSTSLTLSDSNQTPNRHRTTPKVKPLRTRADETPNPTPSMTRHQSTSRPNSRSEAFSPSHARYSGDTPIVRSQGLLDCRRSEQWSSFTSSGLSKGVHTTERSQTRFGTSPSISRTEFRANTKTNNGHLHTTSRKESAGWHARPTGVSGVSLRVGTKEPYSKLDSQGTHRLPSQQTTRHQAQDPEIGYTSLGCFALYRQHANCERDAFHLEYLRLLRGIKPTTDLNDYTFAINLAEYVDMWSSEAQAIWSSCVTLINNRQVHPVRMKLKRSKGQRDALIVLLLQSMNIYWKALSRRWANHSSGSRRRLISNIPDLKVIRKFKGPIESDFQFPERIRPAGGMPAAFPTSNPGGYHVEWNEFEQDPTGGLVYSMTPVDWHEIQEATAKGVPYVTDDQKRNAGVPTAKMTFDDLPEHLRSLLDAKLQSLYNWIERLACILNLNPNFVLMTCRQIKRKYFELLNLAWQGRMTEVAVNQTLACYVLAVIVQMSAMEIHRCRLLPNMNQEEKPQVSTEDLFLMSLQDLMRTQECIKLNRNTQLSSSTDDLTFVRKTYLMMASAPDRWCTAIWPWLSQEVDRLECLHFAKMHQQDVSDDKDSNDLPSDRWQSKYMIRVNELICDYTYTLKTCHYMKLATFALLDLELPGGRRYAPKRDTINDLPDTDVADTPRALVNLMKISISVTLTCVKLFNNHSLLSEYSSTDLIDAWTIIVMAILDSLPVSMLGPMDDLFPAATVECDDSSLLALIMTQLTTSAWIEEHCECTDIHCCPSCLRTVHNIDDFHQGIWKSRTGLHRICDVLRGDGHLMTVIDSIQLHLKEFKAQENVTSNADQRDQMIIFPEPNNLPRDMTDELYRQWVELACSPLPFYDSQSCSPILPPSSIRPQAIPYHSHIA